MNNIQRIRTENKVGRGWGQGKGSVLAGFKPGPKCFGSLEVEDLERTRFQADEFPYKRKGVEARLVVLFLCKPPTTVSRHKSLDLTKVRRL